MKYYAYWISPAGEIIPVNDTHIDLILQYPETFGYTSQEVKEMYDKYDEDAKLFSEGKAREEIMKDLLDNNWIRIRFVPRSYAFTIQTNKIDSRKKDYLWDWARFITNGKLDRLESKSYNINYITANTHGDTYSYVSTSKLDDMLHYNINEAEQKYKATILHLYS